MPIYATAGDRLFIGTQYTGELYGNATEADFADQSAAWVEVRPLFGLGSLGDSAESIDATSINNARKYKLKGPRDAGTMEIVCGLDLDDPGQIAMVAAEASPQNYAFRLIFNDAPDGGTPSERLFAGLVMSVAESYGDASGVHEIQFNLGVNSSVVRIQAAEA